MSLKVPHRLQVDLSLKACFAHPRMKVSSTPSRGRPRLPAPSAGARRVDTRGQLHVDGAATHIGSLTAVPPEPVPEQKCARRPHHSGPGRLSLGRHRTGLRHSKNPSDHRKDSKHCRGTSEIALKRSFKRPEHSSHRGFRSRSAHGAPTQRRDWASAPPQRSSRAEKAGGTGARRRRGSVDSETLFVLF